MNNLRRHHPSVSVDSAKKRDSGTKVQLLLSEGEGGGGVYIAKGYAALFSRYNIPSRKHFSNTVIPEVYEQSRQGIGEELSNTAYVALTTDGWTSQGYRKLPNCNGSLHHFGVGDKKLRFARLTLNNCLYSLCSEPEFQGVVDFFCQINKMHVEIDNAPTPLPLYLK